MRHGRGVSHALVAVLIGLAVSGCVRQPPRVAGPNIQPDSLDAMAYGVPGRTPIKTQPYIATSDAPAPIRNPKFVTDTSPFAQGQPLEAPYTLDGGDRVRVMVFGQEGLNASYIIDPSGQITLPLAGSIQARGLTKDQLSAAIAAKLKQGYIRDPQVAVDIEIYRPFFILGEVTSPGQYPYVANMTAETAVAIAGGFTPRADRKDITIIRMIKGVTYRGKLPPATPLRPGDTIDVGERWF